MINYFKKHKLPYIIPKSQHCRKDVTAIKACTLPFPPNTNRREKNTVNSLGYSKL